MNSTSAIFNYYKTNDPIQKNPSLATGWLGVLILKLLESKNEAQRTQIIDEIAFSALTTPFSPSLHFGSLGYLWFFESLAPQFGSQKNKKRFQGIVDTLYSQLFDFLKSQNPLPGRYELMSGYSGFGYALKELEIKKICLEYLKTTAVLSQNNHHYWQAPDEELDIWGPHLKLKKNALLGISHGVSAPLIFLSSLSHQKNPLQKQAKELATSTAKFLLDANQKLKGESLRHFYKDTLTRPPMWGWCHGDLSVGFALIKSGYCLKNKHFQSEGLKILNRGIDGLLMDNNTHPYHICHGYLGASLICLRAGQALKNRDLKKKATHFKGLAIAQSKKTPLSLNVIPQKMGLLLGPGGFLFLKYLQNSPKIKGIDAFLMTDMT